MSDAVYYEKPVLLHRDTHRRVKVARSSSYAFARKANSLYLAGAEFAEAGKEFAIVFTRVNGQKVVPVAMLGLRARENLFVDADARWTSSYVPAFVRRYPFVLSELQGGQLGVCIDEAYSGLNDPKGEALFDDKGGNTPFLQNALTFLEHYQQEYQRTDLFCQHLVSAGVLSEMNARADLVDGRSFTVNGLMVVDEKKLLALPDATALQLFRSGELHWISLHLASLTNLQGLVDKVAARKATMAPAPKPASAT
jgi:hypothetical protein